MFAQESATLGLHLRTWAGIIRNTNVAYLVNAFYLVMEESIDGCHANTQRHDEHRSDRKTSRAPRPTYARVARPHERGGVWHLVPGQARGRVYRGQAGPGPAQHTGLRACDAGNAGRAHRPGARSEEHTSELQSHVNLVCRLLLEKKKKNQIQDLATKKNTKPKHR